MILVLFLQHCVIFQLKKMISIGLRQEAKMILPLIPARCSPTISFKVAARRRLDFVGGVSSALLLGVTGWDHACTA